MIETISACYTSEPHRVTTATLAILTLKVSYSKQAHRRLAFLLCGGRNEPLMDDLPSFVGASWPDVFFEAIFAFIIDAFCSSSLMFAS